MHFDNIHPTSPLNYSHINNHLSTPFQCHVFFFLITKSSLYYACTMDMVLSPGTTGVWLS